MTHKIKYLLASTALVAGLLQAAPSLGETTTVRETVTTTPDTSTIVTTTPDTGTVRKTIVTETTAVDPTVTTETHTNGEMRISSGRGERKIRFMDFDENGDGRLSFNEVAHIMFKFYDLDGNGVIDNNEYEKHLRIAILPIEKETTVTYDYGDGETKVSRTYETFMNESRLARFAQTQEGLSAHEFADRDFMQADVNHDHGVDLKEWEGTYIASIDKSNKEKARVNH